MPNDDQTIASYFDLNKSQSELDFANVSANSDFPLFIDPLAVTLLPDPWTLRCAYLIQYFFQNLVDRIRAGDSDEALRLLGQLREPNETRLGLSRGRPRGAGIGSGQALEVYEALAESAAVSSGFINHLEETELMVDGIGRDKVSDIATNIIRGELVSYTQAQCSLHSISMQPSPLPPIFDASDNRWISQYHNLPVTDRGPLLLVPKSIVRYDLSYNHQKYYRRFVLDFLRAEELAAGGSLVRALKNGQTRVYKRDIEEKFPVSKQFLFRFSKDHPEILQKYRDELISESNREGTVGDGGGVRIIARQLSKRLAEIEPGTETAGLYHSLMIGILELVLFPYLLHPIKEKEINEGRKRIDILMENGAMAGTALHALHSIKHLPCSYVPIECKNYSKEVANPEFDQLIGRFSRLRGQFGILCCRTIDKPDAALARCRDTLQAGHGLIVVINDDDIHTLLGLIAAGHEQEIDGFLWHRISLVWAT